MTQQDLDVYFNWSCNQLAGDPVATDAYLRQNLEVVKKVAARLLRGYKPQLLYRGVIMRESGLTELQPSIDFTYLSFSEDKNVAKVFADPEHHMAVELRAVGKCYGYMTEYTPKIEEILFHYVFLEMFPYVECLLLKINVDGTKLHEQKEVTILQPKHPLILKSINDYDKRNSAII